MGAVAVVGGTGPPGKGLGYRFARRGHDVVLGSRAGDRALPAAGELAGASPVNRPVIHATNTWAVRAADTMPLAVPFHKHDDLAKELAHELVERIVVSCVDLLDRQGSYGLDLGPATAAKNAQRILFDSREGGAFHHASALSLDGDVDELDHHQQRQIEPGPHLCPATAEQ